MTQKTRAAITTEITTNLASGTSITALLLRGVVQDINDSAINLLDKTPATITYGSTSTISADSANCGIETLTGNTTLSVTGSPVEGQTLRIGFYASGGSYTVALPTGNFTFPSTTTSTSPFTVASGTETLLALMWSTRLSKWRVVSLVGGY